MKQKQGLIHIYTGEGKGKTTASVGLAIRALGHNFNVVYASFFKKPGALGYTEIDVLKSQGATVFSFAEGMPLANPQITPEEYHFSTKSGLAEIEKYVHKNQTELLVLDEILIAILCGFISEEELLSFVANKPLGMELVLTGRGATAAIKEVADYVTVLEKEKHPFDNGVASRIGIEY